MTIEWKKISEYPLPEGDGVKFFIFKNKYGCEIINYPRTYNRKDITTHWAEINLPEEDKEPEIELWSVYEYCKEPVIITAVSKDGVVCFNPLGNNVFTNTTDHFNLYFKPRPDLEVLAPVIYKCDHRYFESEGLFNKDDAKFYIGDSFYQWPSSLSAMIVVPKGGV